MTNEELLTQNKAMAAKIELLEALLIKMQQRTVYYLTPHGEESKTFINFIIGCLDGPEQRTAQAPLETCARALQVEAVAQFLNGTLEHSIKHDAYRREEQLKS